MMMMNPSRSRRCSGMVYYTHAYIWEASLTFRRRVCNIILFLFSRFSPDRIEQCHHKSIVQDVQDTVREVLTRLDDAFGQNFHFNTDGGESQHNGDKKIVCKIINGVAGLWRSKCREMGPFCTVPSGFEGIQRQTGCSWIANSLSRVPFTRNLPFYAAKHSPFSVIFRTLSVIYHI